MGLSDPDRQTGTGQSTRYCGSRQGPKNSNRGSEFEEGTDHPQG